MVVIRMSRGGSKKRPHYSIVVTDRRKRRDGAFIERLGFYNPQAKGNEESLRLDLDGLDAWVAKGAQLSDTVRDLSKRARKAAKAA